MLERNSTMRKDRKKKAGSLEGDLINKVLKTKMRATMRAKMLQTLETSMRLGKVMSALWIRDQITPTTYSNNQMRSQDL